MFHSGDLDDQKDMLGIKQGRKGAGEGSSGYAKALGGGTQCHAVGTLKARVGDAGVRRAGRGPAGRVWSLDIIALQERH